MPLQNRVTPEGEIIAVQARGSMMGNRGGTLHNEKKELRRRRWVSRQWICCLLSFNSRHREVMAPNHYTELFFLDEATALAAGHRPCFECRRQDFLSFATTWAKAEGRADRATASAMDEVLHAERVDRHGSKVVWESPVSALPPGTFVRLDGRPHLVLRGGLAVWTPAGYSAVRPRTDAAMVEVLTPKTIVAVLAAGYRPGVHPSANVAA